MSDNYEVFIYKNHVEVCYQTNFYSYYFKKDEKNYVLEKEKEIYIFNKYNVVIFNATYYSFNHLKTQEFKMKDEKIELLCKMQKTNNYFILFKFDMVKNDISIKKLSKGQIKYDNYSLPFLFF